MAGVGMSPQLPTVVRAADGVTRCRWATETGRDLIAYHDLEWGKPTHDEAALFEALVLTYFENGLSWALVFDKRDNLRAAFHGFSPSAVAAMNSDDVERLMADTSIRNRRKIEATLHNADVLSKYSLSQLAWQHQPRGHHRLRSWADGRMASPESRQLSITLRKAGFRLVGPVVAHSFMQTVGIENGHFDGCFLALAADYGHMKAMGGQT
ncbi:MAG TPA: DNA-3-methyladenine glycosylase I [Mycobacterium sp.]|uniref:DNA-3-methyladenine glycosylase I n=1 Tax=Mycobacterium sp. TaxID=1785 RepID=UPI002C0A89F9|nr:DNA-3-methyladenine glycosylase I [Mycobacterium sp.]HME75846.1 DNA-3-methyladenine glycosylase I [Mycobacterium sp.]